jgi:hypothetical protein
MGTTINLTVTGAFDKEGTARTIIDTLNSIPIIAAQAAQLTCKSHDAVVTHLESRN